MSKSEQPASGEPEALSASLRRYLEVLRKRVWVVIACVAVGVTGAVLYTMRLPKIYQATATIVVNPQAPRVFGNQVDEVFELGTGSYWSNQEYYNTQLDIITSFPLARETVQKKVGDVTFVDKLAPKARHPQLSDGERLELAADLLKGKLSANQAKESRIVSISVKDVDGTLAQALANEHVKSYLGYMRGKRVKGTDKVSKFLATEGDAAEADLRAAEEALYEFRRSHDILSVSLEDKQSILASDITRYSSALGDARVKRTELGSQLKKAQSLKGEEVIESPVFALVGSSEAYDTLKNQYQLEQQKLDEIKSLWGPKSDNYTQQQRKVDQIYAGLQAEARRAVRELEVRHSAAIATEGALNAELERLKKEAIALGPLAIEYNRLARQQKAAEDNATMLRGRLRTSEQEGRNEQTNVDEHEYSRGAYLVYPRMKVNVFLAFMATLLLGVGVAFFLDYLDRTIKTAEDVERLVGAPLLGIIPIVTEVPTGDDPKAQKDRDLYVFRNPTSQAAECCRSIRTNILFSAADRPMKTITVSSPRPREGKTTSTIYTGTIMAQSGQRVLLVDTDLRRPRLHKSLGVSKNRGLTNLILGDATVDDVIKSTDIPNLYVLPCGPQPPNPAELLLTNRFKQVLAELESKFDRILLDSPPVLAVTDAVVLARLSSGVMLIAQAGKTLLDDVAYSARQFRDVDAPILGVILNDMDITDRRYGGYYYAYGGYGEHAPSKSAEAEAS
ncbi:MAG: polysaccharide biosynthesis tyrosine autokinase [Kofleriaceae bacterium]|nr:polysaccharide biosynthesis tyrosine autokinase [Kofleriaceae bacterium]MBP9166331.1 polysaccharide biosynthesis tyrosine autokinase [Kofleriaceae bacterium]MBP9858725.1 polysaccharide biosynthesis tyrosine autokinase [Kofleriaceae bacterium]